MPEYATQELAASLLPRGYRNAHLVTYSNGREPYYRNAKAFCASALQHGFKTAFHRTEAELRETPFWRKNSAILEQSRGAGYWLWKPYIIRERLREIPPGDVLIYTDSGRGLIHQLRFFDHHPKTLLKLAAISPKGFIAGWSSDWATQARFTKADCFVLLKANTEKMWNAPQLGATWSVWTPSHAAFKFLNRWLTASCDPRILTDQPDELGEPTQWDYQDHRHDQAVFSIIAHQAKAHYIPLHKRELKKVVHKCMESAPNQSDFLKRVSQMDDVVSSLVPKSFLNARDLTCLESVDQALSNVDHRSPIPDYSLARQTEYPALRFKRFVEYASSDVGKIDWMLLNSAIHPRGKTLLRAYIKGRKGGEVRAFRDELLEDVKAHLPLRAGGSGNAGQQLRRMVLRRVEEMLRRKGVDVPPDAWPLLQFAMTEAQRNDWSMLNLHMQPADRLPMRARLSELFLEARKTAANNSEAVKMIAGDMQTVFNELVAGVDPRSPFPRWWFLWQSMSDETKAQWLAAVHNLPNWEIIDLQSALADAVPEASDFTQPTALAERIAGVVETLLGQDDDTRCPLTLERVSNPQQVEGEKHDHRDRPV